MTYISIVISWIVGILTNFPSTWISTDFSNGKCEAYMVWSYQDALGYGIFYVFGVVYFSNHNILFTVTCKFG